MILLLELLLFLARSGRGRLPMVSLVCDTGGPTVYAMLSL